MDRRIPQICGADAKLFHCPHSYFINSSADAPAKAGHAEDYINSELGYSNDAIVLSQTQKLHRNKITRDEKANKRPDY